MVLRVGGRGIWIDCGLELGGSAPYCALLCAA
eukprot:COSAG03_NODE_18382_length_356_cov_0.809339_1_plen_31_part_10